MSDYGPIIIGRNNGQPPVEITDKMLDASIPLVTLCDCGSIEKELSGGD